MRKKVFVVQNLGLFLISEPSGPESALSRWKDPQPSPSAESGPPLSQLVAVQPCEHLPSAFATRPLDSAGGPTRWGRLSGRVRARPASRRALFPRPCPRGATLASGIQRSRLSPPPNSQPTPSAIASGDRKLCKTSPPPRRKMLSIGRLANT